MQGIEGDASARVGPSDKQFENFFSNAHSKVPKAEDENALKKDFYSFCSALSDTKYANNSQFKADLKKAEQWGQGKNVLRTWSGLMSY